MSDDTPISDTDAIFTRAYANAIKTKFQLDLGKRFCILTSPVTQRGIAAGDLIYPQMTNYLIYKLADALQFSDNPSYTGASAGSYIQQLRSYIDWVKTEGDTSQVTVERLARARGAATAANANYQKVLEEARIQYAVVKSMFPSMTFWQWAEVHYLPLDASDRMRKSVQTELYQAMEVHYGPDAATLSTYIDNISNAQSPNPYPGYNQDGLVADEDLIANAIKYANSGQKPPDQHIERLTIRVPAYTIASYISQVQAWITAAKEGAKRDQIITIDINKGRNTSWRDYGFKEIHGGGGFGIGLSPFFFAEVYVGRKWERRTLNTEGRESSVSLQLAMIGIQKFDIQPGQWDIPDIKTLFPNRLPAAPDVLSPRLARVVSILVGYDVELKVKFASDIKEEVNQIYEEVKATGGRLSIFGFTVAVSVGVGGLTERVETKFSDVKWDKNSGLMNLTPTKGQVYPTILGAVAQRFD